VGFYYAASAVSNWRLGSVFPFGLFLSVHDARHCRNLRAVSYAVTASAGGLNAFCRGPQSHLIGAASTPRTCRSRPRRLFSRERWRYIVELNLTPSRRFTPPYRAVRSLPRERRGWRNAVEEPGVEPCPTLAVSRGYGRIARLPAESAATSAREAAATPTRSSRAEASRTSESTAGHDAPPARPGLGRRRPALSGSSPSNARGAGRARPPSRPPSRRPLGQARLSALLDHQPPGLSGFEKSGPPGSCSRRSAVTCSSSQSRSGYSAHGTTLSLRDLSPRTKPPVLLSLAARATDPVGTVSVANTQDTRLARTHKRLGHAAEDAGEFPGAGASSRN